MRFFLGWVTEKTKSLMKRLSKLASMNQAEYLLYMTKTLEMLKFTSAILTTIVSDEYTTTRVWLIRPQLRACQCASVETVFPLIKQIAKLMQTKNIKFSKNRLKSLLQMAQKLTWTVSMETAIHLPNGSNQMKITSKLTTT